MWLRQTGVVVWIVVVSSWQALAEAPAAKRVSLVVHGGAGAMRRGELEKERVRQCEDTLRASLRAGYEVLQQEKGTSEEAVEAAIRVLEDSPLFNAGQGAVFTREGRNELDAAIMEGKTKRAGAVAAVTRIRNPICAARAVMERSEHVLLVGEGAEQFARSVGLVEVNPLYFWTEARWKVLKEAEEKQQRTGQTLRRDVKPSGEPLGTVGAVAVDRLGNLAAGTSTGGLTFKRAGRVGDSPIIGAGTYADNETCAVSCTGHGEVFIRYTVAYDVAARMKYRGISLGEAAEEVLSRLPKESQGVGGLIALDRHGHFATPFNTRAMFRGYATNEGEFHVAVFER